MSALHLETSGEQELTHPVPKIALQLHAILEHRAAGATGALQFLRKVLQELRVLRQAVDNCHRLSAATGFFHPEPGDGAGRDWFVRGFATATTALGLAAGRADAAGGRGIDSAAVVAHTHRVLQGTVRPNARGLWVRSGDVPIERAQSWCALVA